MALIAIWSSPRVGGRRSRCAPTSRSTVLGGLDAARLDSSGVELRPSRGARPRRARGAARSAQASLAVAMLATARAAPRCSSPAEARLVRDARRRLPRRTFAARGRAARRSRLRSTSRSSTSAQLNLAMALAMVPYVIVDIFAPKRSTAQLDAARRGLHRPRRRDGPSASAGVPRARSPPSALNLKSEGDRSRVRRCIPLSCTIARSRRPPTRAHPRGRGARGPPSRGAPRVEPAERGEEAR